MGKQTINSQAVGSGASAKGGGFRNFGFSLFLGCCVVALGIIIAGHTIARQIPDTLHGSLHGSFSGTLMDGSDSPREFMSKWEAARFLRMAYEQLDSLIDSGELDGTYAVFQVEEHVWHMVEHPGEAIGGNIVAPTLAPVIAETIIRYHRVFSRERLSEWLHGRME